MSRRPWADAIHPALASSGPVTRIGNTSITATCATGDGASWTLRLVIGSVERRGVTGTLTATPGGAAQPGSGGAAGGL